MSRVNWPLVTAARESGGRIPPSRLRTLLAGDDLEEQVAAFARRGYRFTLNSRGTLELADWPHRLFAEEIAHDLGTEVVGTKVETHWTVASTNDLARAHAARGHEGVAVFAEEQTAGRGRFGRRWVAPKYSSLLFSVPLKPSNGGVASEGLALAGAVAVAEALGDVYSLSSHIRWPNDVLVEGRKVCGVLVERMANGPERWLVAGIGVNVNVPEGSMPADLRTAAAGVSDFTGKRADRALLARTILRRLDFWWLVLSAGERERLTAAWRALSDILGTFVTVESRGKRTTGRVVDLDEHYGLILQLAGGPTRAFAPAQTTVIH